MNAAKIVLIEDNPADVFLVETALKENDIPYEMTRFKNGEEAVASLGLITGIGFVGGGAILKEGTTVKGTATAASESWGSVHQRKEYGRLPRSTRWVLTSLRAQLLRISGIDLSKYSDCRSRRLLRSCF